MCSGTPQHEKQLSLSPCITMDMTAVHPQQPLITSLPYLEERARPPISQRGQTLVHQEASKAMVFELTCVLRIFSGKLLILCEAAYVFCKII
jgi:hypothetical protein